MAAKDEPCMDAVGGVMDEVESAIEIIKRSDSRYKDKHTLMLKRINAELEQIFNYYQGE